MHIVLAVFHVVACVLLILIVLLQAGKSGGFAGLFGGGSSEMLFSAPSGSAFLKKITTIMAIVFMCTSLFLTFLSNQKGMRSVTDLLPQSAAPTMPEPAPSQPSAPAPTVPSAPSAPVPAAVPPQVPQPAGTGK